MGKHERAIAEIQHGPDWGQPTFAVLDFPVLNSFAVRAVPRCRAALVPAAQANSHQALARVTFAVRRYAEQAALRRAHCIDINGLVASPAIGAVSHPPPLPQERLDGWRAPLSSLLSIAEEGGGDKAQGVVASQHDVQAPIVKVILYLTIKLVDIHKLASHQAKPTPSAGNASR